MYIESARQIDRRKGRRIQSKDEETKTSISWCLLWVTNIIVWPLKVHLYSKNTGQNTFPPFKNTRWIHIYAHCWCYFSFFHHKISVAQNVPLFSLPTKRIVIIIFWFVFAMVFAIEWFCMHENALFCYDSHLPLNLFDCDTFATLCANKRACASKGVLICFEQKNNNNNCQGGTWHCFRTKKNWENCENMKVTWIGQKCLINDA